MTNNRIFLKEIKSMYQLDKTLMPETFIILKLDGRKFKKFCEYYNFWKPNDQLHVNLMNKCSMEIFKKYKYDALLSYSFSDEFNLAFSKKTDLYNRNYR
jgi:tRNA(His) guanylyltransferase